jgi:hypothetical protein
VFLGWVSMLLGFPVGWRGSAKQYEVHGRGLEVVNDVRR